MVAYAPAVDGFQERVGSAMAVYSPRLTVTFTNEPTLPQALEVLKALPKDSLILWVRYSPVTKGRVIFPDEFLPEIAAAAPVPIYARSRTFLGNGVVGGMMRNSIDRRPQTRRDGTAYPRRTPPERIPSEDADVQPDLRLAGVAALGTSTSQRCRPVRRFAIACRPFGSCTGSISWGRSWS